MMFGRVHMNKNRTSYTNAHQYSYTNAQKKTCYIKYGVLSQVNFKTKYDFSQNKVLFSSK